MWYTRQGSKLQPCDPKHLWSAFSDHPRQRLERITTSDRVLYQPLDAVPGLTTSLKVTSLYRVILPHPPIPNPPNKTAVDSDTTHAALRILAPPSTGATDALTRFGRTSPDLFDDGAAHHSALVGFGEPVREARYIWGCKADFMSVN